MWITKRALKQQVKELNDKLRYIEEVDYQLQLQNQRMKEQLDDMLETYPFYIGQVVYDVQLRNNKGRFTKTKASREHSMINEVVVDTKNYFNLVNRYKNNDVFTELNLAETHLNAVCVE